MPLSDQDLDLLKEYGEAVGFLDTLDHKGIARYVIPSCQTHVLNLEQEQEGDSTITQAGQTRPTARK